VNLKRISIADRVSRIRKDFDFPYWKDEKRALTRSFCRVEVMANLKRFISGAVRNGDTKRKPTARMNAASNQATSVSKAEPVVEPTAQPTTPPAPRPTAPAATAVKSRGRPSQYWLHDEDRRALRKLAAWLAGQGERPTDSLVIRSVLQMATAGPDLLKAYRRAAQLDGRLKQRGTPETWHSQPSDVYPTDNLVPL
jgi:hypothetical protein